MSTSISRLWVIVMVFGCLVPGPGIIKAEEYCLLGTKARSGAGGGGGGVGWGGEGRGGREVGRSRGLDWLVCISEACTWLGCSLGKLSLLSEKDFVIVF